jgi:hypothetical protein
MEPPEKLELSKMQAVMVKYLPHNVGHTMKSKRHLQVPEKSMDDVSGNRIQTTPTLRKVNS